MVAPREITDELIKDINSYIMSTKGITTTTVMKHFSIGRRTLYKLQSDGLVKLPAKMSSAWSGRLGKQGSHWRNFVINHKESV